MTYNQLQVHFFLALLVANLILAFLVLRPFMSALVLAATFAVIFQPVYQWLLRVFKREIPAALLTVLSVLLIIFIPLALFSTQIFQEARDFYVQVSENRLEISQQLANLGEERLGTLLPRVSVNLEQYTRQIASWLVQQFGTIFSSVAQMLVTFALSLLALYYFLKDGPRLRKAIIRLSPLFDRYDRKIFDRLHTAVSSVVKGSLIIAILQGISTAVGFAITGVPHAALWGSLAVVTALIPNVGTALVIAPGVLYLVALDHLVAAGLLVAWGLTAVGLIDNLLGPKLIERGLRIHPMLILLAVIGGLSVFGPIGFLLGPLILSLLFALLDIYQVLILKEPKKVE